jgi:hypothetical protein
MSGRGVKCVFFHAVLRHRAGTLALVEYADGVIVVLHNDQPVGAEWTTAELEQAVIEFTQRQRKLEADAAEHAREPERRDAGNPATVSDAR